jgi:hypothetical protein
MASVGTASIISESAMQKSTTKDLSSYGLATFGVWPGALTNEDGSSLPVAGKFAVACKKVLEKYDILDVDCEIRESEVGLRAVP